MTTLVIDMPWSSGADETRFRRLLRQCLIATIVLSVIIPFIPLPTISREAEEKVPPQLAEIVLKKPVARPLPARPKPIEPKAKKTHREKPAPKPQAHRKTVTRPAPQTVTQAREKASHAGILAFQDALADMRTAVDPASLRATHAIARGSGKASTVDRHLLTSKGGTRRANVNLAALSRETGGVALSARKTTVVKGHHEASGDAASGAVRTAAAGISRVRSIEDIRRVFDANKGAIYAIYNRALRQDPTLVGKVVLELEIQPDGHVSHCRVVSSDIDNKSMVTRVVERVEMFDFGKADVAVTTINYPVHFLPS